MPTIPLFVFGVCLFVVNCAA